jgi:NTE family protein
MGGGGLTGVSWLTGVLAAFEAADIPVADTDLALGTSAGSVVATQLVARRSFTDKYHFLSDPKVRAREMLIRLYESMPKPTGEVLQHLSEQWDDSAASTQASRAEEGAQALDADTMPATAWVTLIALYVRTHHWPGRALAITAVDAEDGAFKVFREEDGVHVSRAVAASSAVPEIFPPVKIEGRRYIDGGTRSVTNADVAEGNDVVLLFVDHRTTPGKGPLSLAELETEIESLRAKGTEVVKVSPDEASLQAIGQLEALDPARVGPSARAGFEQGRAEAERVAAAWPVRPS